MGVREIAKFANQKAKHPATANIDAFRQISFDLFIFFSPLYTGFIDNWCFTPFMESHKAREISAIKLITKQGYEIIMKPGKRNR